MAEELTYSVKVRMTERVDGEKVRAIQHLRRLRTIVDQVLSDLENGAPIPGPDVAQAVAHTGVDVARTLAALSAYDRSRDDATWVQSSKEV